MGHVVLVAINGTIILVPYQYVKSLSIHRKMGHQYALYLKSHWNSFEDRASVNEIYEYPILNELQWLDLIKIGSQDSSTSDSCWGDMPC